MRFRLLVALALLASGCSQGAASQAADAPLKITTSQMYVTVRNESGLPINDVSVAIIPMGRTTTYTKFVGRVDNASERNVMLGDFFGRDGTPFSLRVAKPRSVQVTGKDVKGKDYSVEVAWQ